MNSRERVFAALSRTGVPDRVPVQFDLCRSLLEDFGQKYGIPIHYTTSYFEDLTYRISANELRTEMGSDCVIVGGSLPVGHSHPTTDDGCICSLRDHIAAVTPDHVWTGGVGLKPQGSPATNIHIQVRGGGDSVAHAVYGDGGTAFYRAAGMDITVKGQPLAWRGRPNAHIAIFEDGDAVGRRRRRGGAAGHQTYGPIVEADVPTMTIGSIGDNPGPTARRTNRNTGPPEVKLGYSGNMELGRRAGHADAHVARHGGVYVAPGNGPITIAAGQTATRVIGGVGLGGPKRVAHTGNPLAGLELRIALHLNPQPAGGASEDNVC